MAAGIVERIQVKLQLLTKDFNKNMNRSMKPLRDLNKNVGDFGNVMTQPIDKLKKMNGRFKVMKSSGGKLAFSMRKLTHGMRGFRVEMLGVMFFGMSLTRIFKSLTRTSFEWFGVTEIMSAALGLLFLPVAEKISDWALKFLDWVSQLTPKQKEMVGKVILLVGAMGLLLTVFGTLALGIGSVILAFGSLFTPIGILLALFAVFAGSIIFKDLFKNIGNSSDKAKEKLVAFGFSGEAFDKVKEKLVGFFIILKEKFSGLREKFKVWFDDFLPRALEFGKKILSKMWEGIKEKFPDMKEKIKGFIGKVLEWIGEKSPEIIEAGGKIVRKIGDGILSKKEEIGNAIEKILTVISEWIRDNSSAIIELGIEIAKSLIKGIAIGLKNLFVGLVEAVGGRIAENILTNKSMTLRERIAARRNLPNFDKGGIVPGSPGTPVPILAHGGETIIPSGQSTSGFAPTINITANVSSDYDVRRLAEQLKRFWVSDFERVSQGRTV